MMRCLAANRMQCVEEENKKKNRRKKKHVVNVK